MDKAQALVLERMDEMTPSQAMLASCQAQDKGLLLSGKPTSIRADSQTTQSMAAEFAQLSRDMKRVKQDHDNIQDSIVSTQKGPTK